LAIKLRIKAKSDCNEVEHGKGKAILASEVKCEKGMEKS